MTQKNLQYTPRHSLHEHILKICHAIELPLHYNRKGPKIFTNYQRVAVIVLYLRSKKSLRDFVSEMYETKWPNWLGLKEIPAKSTVNDWMKLFDMSFVRKLNHQLLAKEKPEVMAIDATGIDSWRRSRHYERRIGESYMPYAKADLLVDTKTKLIHDFVVRMKPRHDVLGAKTIFNRLGSKNILILADRGYDSEPLHKLVVQKGNILFAPIRDFKVRKPKGKNRQRCSQGNENYSMRSIVESVNHALKARIGALRNKKHYNKKREFAWYVVLYNLQKISTQISAYLNWLLIGIPDRAILSKPLYIPFFSCLLCLI